MNTPEWCTVLIRDWVTVPNRSIMLCALSCRPLTQLSWQWCWLWAGPVLHPRMPCLAQSNNATAFVVTVPDENQCKPASLIAARCLGCCPFVT